MNRKSPQLAAGGRIRTFDSLRHRGYRSLWLATVCSSSAFWFHQVIMGWLAYDRTGSPLLTTLVVSLDALPALVGAPLMGLMGDAWDRKKLLVVSYGYMAAMLGALALLVLLDRVQAWHLLLFSLLFGLSWALADPTRMALIPNLVPRGELVNAFALNSLAFNGTRFAAPALGGILIAVMGPGWSLLVEVGVNFVACAAALSIQGVPPPRRKLQLTSLVRELREGLRYAVREPVVLSVLLLGVVPALLVYPFVAALMPVYAAEVFHVGPRGLGLLFSALGVGAATGTVALASFGDVPRKGRLMLGAILAAGLASIAFSQSPWLGLSLVILVGLGSALSVFFSSSSALVQSLTPDAFRGRVAGLYMMGWGLSPLGSLLSGSIAQRFDPAWATLAAGIAVLLACAAIARRFPALLRLQQ
jgi:MFS family permease